MALWLYATLDGVGAARELDRLCKDHVAYQWICGGVSVNYHSLSDFRGNIGSDMGQMGQMIDQHKDRYGRPPGEMLADGGFASHDDIDSASTADEPTVIYAPVQISRKTGTPCYDRQPADTDAVALWRQRMATPEAKDIYKQRAATAECVNALARNRGLQQFLVRGGKHERFRRLHSFTASIRIADSCIPDGWDTFPEA